MSEIIKRFFMIKESTLSEHILKKGKFITPLNYQFGDVLQENPWFKTRLPEYIWLGLIINHYGREEGLKKCNRILKVLYKKQNLIEIPKLSIILGLTQGDQDNLYKNFKGIIDSQVLSPLTLIFTYSKFPVFASNFYSTLSLEERLNRIDDVLEKTSDQQSELSTDIKFLILAHQINIGKLYTTQETAELFSKYPLCSHKDEIMRLIRPNIRACEVSLPNDYNSNYLDTFWEGLSRMNKCILSYIEYTDNHNDSEKYVKTIKEKLLYYTNMFSSTRPLDNRMLVIIGTATYAYKRMLEVVEHSLYHSIAGRSVVRVMIESYIILKYLLLKESEHSDIWTEYQYYGIGQYKLIAERFRELGVDLPESHVEYNYIDFLVSEYKNKEFIDMDTSYFDKINVREKAKAIGEKQLFGLYYDYDSAFEHGLWGAIRESSLLKCNEVSHQYHCVPDVDNEQRMKDVWNDCKMAMDKIMSIIQDLYGLPDSFSEEASDE